jgi:hypothetical protein
MEAVGASETLLHTKTHSVTSLSKLVNSKTVLLNAMRAKRGRRGTASLILNLITVWK